MSLRSVVFLMFNALILFHLQLLGQQPQPPSTPGAQTSSTALTPPADRRQQMRADLNQMESLMNNMTSEITFLRDQNLQILLNTNVRMWTILIRDLRAQLDEEERKPDPRSQPPTQRPPNP